jgi:hypothetical protein
MNKVEQKFKQKAIERGGLFLYSKKNAMEFVNECRHERIHLLGVDGFSLTENSTQPSINDSIDFSSSFFRGEMYEKAIDFLEQRSDALFFEIICE